MIRLRHLGVHATWLAMAAILAAWVCGSCRSISRSSVSSGVTPTVRLYLVSDVAGALEVCGCTGDQRGGLTHVAALLASERPSAPASALVASGPLFFASTTLDDAERGQARQKAATLAASLKDLGLVAFAAGKNDWSAGETELRGLALETGAALLGADGAAGERVLVRSIGGVNVGFVGVSAPPATPARAATSTGDAAKAGYARAKAQGADLVVLLASLGRRESRNVAKVVPDFSVILVGSPELRGDGSEETPAPERVGKTLLVQTAPHLANVAVLDLYIRDGSFDLADAPGKAGQGSFLRYEVRDIRQSLGSDAHVDSLVKAYDAKVNADNAILLQAVLPPPTLPGEGSFVGADACSVCHDEARAFWDTTKHARAYATLTERGHEANLDCVECHVTGYQQPSGSTVMHVERLRNVQCEVCHGPGSLHAARPEHEAIPVPKPDATLCARCHKAPQQERFDPAGAMAKILGPGHRHAT